MKPTRNAPSGSGEVGHCPAYAQSPMADDQLGPWDPLELAELTRLFHSWPSRWWISGGVALELYLARSWRLHEDTDVSILRADAYALPEVLVGWDCEVAADGTLTPWSGSPLSAQASQNNVWCRRAPDQPWCVDVTISDGDDTCWIYRRDPTLRVLWEDAVLKNDLEIPYLAPELQLLFKSKNNRSKDDRDAAEVIPELSVERQQRLRLLLPNAHPWQVLLPD